MSLEKTEILTQFVRKRPGTDRYVIPVAVPVRSMCIDGPWAKEAAIQYAKKELPVNDPAFTAFGLIRPRASYTGPGPTHEGVRPMDGQSFLSMALSDNLADRAVKAGTAPEGWVVEVEIVG